MISYLLVRREAEILPAGQVKVTFLWDSWRQTPAGRKFTSSLLFICKCRWALQKTVESPFCQDLITQPWKHRMSNKVTYKDSEKITLNCTMRSCNMWSKAGITNNRYSDNDWRDKGRTNYHIRQIEREIKWEDWVVLVGRLFIFHLKYMIIEIRLVGRHGGGRGDWISGGGPGEDPGRLGILGGRVVVEGEERIHGPDLDGDVLLVDLHSCQVMSVYRDSMEQFGALKEICLVADLRVCGSLVAGNRDFVAGKLGRVNVFGRKQSVVGRPSMKGIKPREKRLIKRRKRWNKTYYLTKIGALGFLFRRQVFFTSGRWRSKEKRASTLRTSGRRSSTPRRLLIPFPESFTMLNKRKNLNRKIGIMVTDIPNGIISVTLEKLRGCELVVGSYSLVEGGELGGDFLEGVTHGGVQRTHMVEGLGDVKFGIFCLLWPITDKGGRLLVNKHVQERKLSEGGSSWKIKTTKKKQIHKVFYIKLCFYL